jgi:homoserine acetyltransferase
VYLDPKWQDGKYRSLSKIEVVSKAATGGGMSAGMMDDSGPVQGLSLARLMSMMWYRSAPAFLRKFDPPPSLFALGNGGVLSDDEGTTRVSGNRSSDSNNSSSRDTSGSRGSAHNNGNNSINGPSRNNGSSGDSDPSKKVKPADDVDEGRNTDRNTNRETSGDGLDENSKRMSSFGFDEESSIPRSYLLAQGQKFIDRFDAASYCSTVRHLLSHDIGRDRGGIERALGRIRQPCLIFGISSDLLFPILHQEELVHYLPDADLKIFYSDEGHDGVFLDCDVYERDVISFLQTRPAPVNPLGVNTTENRHRAHAAVGMRKKTSSEIRIVNGNTRFSYTSFLS